MPFWFLIHFFDSKHSAGYVVRT